jgi:hypothetical protein
MADELRQAAVREFARLDAEESARETITGACSQERLDRYHLASAVIEAHPADDGAAVDEAWLRAVGFRDKGDPIGGADSLVAVAPDGGADLEYVPGSGGWYYCGTPLPAQPTRGHVRRLALALGVELPAAATDGPAAE